jgi:multisubunit Na+/H+ antiporter MnhB subunit
MSRASTMVFFLLAAILAGWLLIVVAQLPFSGGLQEAVAEAARAHDLPQPVTAVLLVLRGYDTWLEVAVLLLAALAVLHLQQGAKPASSHAPALLEAFSRWLLPAALLVSGYLLWLGTHAPGGAFQAGALMAAVLVLLDLSGVRILKDFSGWRFRLLLALGFFLPILLTLLPLLNRAPLFSYPEGVTTWVLIVEAGIALSVALILTVLFLGVRKESRVRA